MSDIIDYEKRYKKVEAYLNDHPELAVEARATMQRVTSRATTDAEFRQQLLDEPRAALSKFTGNAVPEWFQFRFAESADDVSEQDAAVVVLPPFADADAELEEADLEIVAGGITSLSCVVVDCALAAAAIIATAAVIDAIYD